MTQEEKAKAYDEALERAKKELGTCGSQDCDAARQIFRLFPELKESEDEKIMKALIRFHKSTIDIDGIKGNEIVAWLEKQCNTPKEVTCTQEVEVGNGNIKTLVTEKIPIDKVVPKFKVGDWIITPENNVLQITSIEGSRYRFNNESHYWEICYCDEKCRLWAIQDAKDGDVLFDGSNILLVKEVNHWHNVTSYLAYSQVYGIREYLISGSDVFTPATNEQRDLLFQKMKEAGYEWDTENKQLKKISQRMISAEAKEAMYSNHAWSEEDEKLFEYALDMVEWYDGTNREKSRTVSNWLKSLKVQKQWKPSKEQMDSLRGVINSLPHQQVLLTLYTDLKKLTE